MRVLASSFAEAVAGKGLVEPGYLIDTRENERYHKNI